MRVTVVAVGSRGDIQPLIALGVGLRSAGHEVRLATHAQFEDLAKPYNLDFRAVGPNPRDVLETSKVLEAGDKSTLMDFYKFIRELGPHFERTSADTLQACEGTEVIVFSLLAYSFAYHIAEKMQVPAFLAHWGPAGRSRVVPSMGFPTLPDYLSVVRPYYNVLTSRVVEQISWQLLRGRINRWREQALGLPRIGLLGPYDRISVPGGGILLGYSERVVPRPPDWPDWISITGYWFLKRPAAWTPPPILLDFLASGPPPVFVTLGSVGDAHHRELSETVLEALSLAGHRGIVVDSEAGSDGTVLRDGLLVARDIPYDWLFDRVGAAVYHAGVGTSAWALRAGLPSVLVPLALDQHYWADRIYRVGAAPPPLKRKSLSVESMARAIDAATKDREIKRATEDIGRHIREEDGVARAVEVFHRCLEQSRNRDWA